MVEDDVEQDSSPRRWQASTNRTSASGPAVRFVHGGVPQHAVIAPSRGCRRRRSPASARRVDAEFDEKQLLDCGGQCSCRSECSDVQLVDDRACDGSPAQSASVHCAAPAFHSWERSCTPSGWRGERVRQHPMGRRPTGSRSGRRRTRRRSRHQPSPEVTDSSILRCRPPPGGPARVRRPYGELVFSHPCAQQCHERCAPNRVLAATVPR